jgi:hypothetical protein
MRISSGAPRLEHQHLSGGALLSTLTEAQECKGHGLRLSVNIAANLAEWGFQKTAEEQVKFEDDGN